MFKSIDMSIGDFDNFVQDSQKTSGHQVPTLPPIRKLKLQLWAGLRNPSELQRINALR
jgi:hypothetical protein